MSSPVDYATPGARPALFRSRRFGCAVLAIGFVLTTLVAGTVGFISGAFSSNLRMYEGRFRGEAQKIRAALAAHGDRFQHLSIDRTSTGQAYLEGTIASEAERDVLEAELTKLFGQERAEYGVSMLDVAPSNPRPASRPAPPTSQGS